MRVVIALAFILLCAIAQPAHAQSECDAMLGRIVTATGKISDLIYKNDRDLTQFFVRESSLPCRGTILALVHGRTRCRNGMTVTVQGTWDQAETGTSFSPYVILSDAGAVSCK